VLVSFPFFLVGVRRGLSFFFLETPNLFLSYHVGSMSNAESDRKADGSAEDDDEPDEWCVWFWWRFVRVADLTCRCECELTFWGQGHEDLQHGMCRGEHQAERLLL
jgi:hypothetical protein